MMDKVEEELLTQITCSATESNPIDDFKKRAERDFFATISGFMDKSLYTDENGVYHEKEHNLMKEKATKRLLADLKSLGLSYQKVTGVWDGETEKSFLVWNTAYTWPQFVKVILSLGKKYQQWAICIGRGVGDEKYDIDLYQTDSIEKGKILYTLGDHFTKISVVDALRENGTLLNRKFNSAKETKTAIRFEEIQLGSGLAANESLNGAYHRERLIQNLVKEIG